VVDCEFATKKEKKSLSIFRSAPKYPPKTELNNEKKRCVWLFSPGEGFTKATLLDLLITKKVNLTQ